MSEVILLLDDDPAALAFLNTVLSEAGFTCVESHTVPTPVTWTVASICGFLATTSVAGPRIIGPDRAAFDAALADALLSQDAAGLYSEEIAFGYTLARRP